MNGIVKDGASYLKIQEEVKQLDFSNITKEEYELWLLSLKRVESVVDVDGSEHKLNFLPFII